MINDRDIAFYANLNTDQLMNLLLVSIAVKDLSLVDIMMMEIEKAHKATNGSNESNINARVYKSFNKSLVYWIKQEELSIRKLENILEFFRRREEQCFCDEEEEY